MKNFVLSLLALTVLGTASVHAQGTTPSTAPGHRIGLIDMALVFQEYDKFEGLRNELQAEIEKSDAEAKGMVERLQKMQGELAKFDAGGPQYEAAERQILDEKGKFDSFRASTQRQLARRESEMFKVVYNDVTAAVKLYAEYAKFDHVMRFNSKGITDTTTPQEAVQTMNKTFIYTRSENDITKTVLDYLNKEYAKSGGRQTPATPVSRSTAPSRN